MKFWEFSSSNPHPEFSKGIDNLLTRNLLLLYSLWFSFIISTKYHSKLGNLVTPI
jgi:hypothetical protein